jgi:hypothetical protein
MDINKLQKFCLEGREKWNEYIKLLLYKYDDSIFDKIDFNDDGIYYNPLLFAFFSYNKEETNSNQILQTLLFSSFTKKPNLNLTSKEKVIYLPNIGWLKKGNDELESINLEFSMVNDIENLQIINNTNIELLKYPIDLLDQCYGDNTIEISEITEFQTKNITKAYDIIKSSIPKYFNLINQFCPKNVIYKADTNKVNSFAHISVLGIAFFNAFQESYDEVFFIEDIAHQTGHVLLYTILCDKKQFFLIDDENTFIQDYSNGFKNDSDKRTVEIWLHALFTGYLIFTYLDASIEAKVFNKHQEYEAHGRLLFYIYKIHRDLSLFCNPKQEDKLFNLIDSDRFFEIDLSNTILTNDGMFLFNGIQNKWNEMFSKYYPKLNHLKLNGQTRTFNFEIFLEINPIS